MGNNYIITDGESVTLVFDQSVVRFNKSDLDSAIYKKIVDKVFEEHSIKLAHSGEKVELENLKESLTKSPKARAINTNVVSSVSGKQDDAQIYFETPTDTTLYRSKTGSFCIDDYTEPGAEEPGKTIGPGQYIDINEINTPTVKRAIRANILVPTTVEECGHIRAKANKAKTAREPKGVSRDSGLSMEVGDSQTLLNRSKQAKNTIAIDVDGNGSFSENGDYDGLLTDMAEDDSELVNFE